MWNDIAYALASLSRHAHIYFVLCIVNDVAVVNNNFATEVYDVVAVLEAEVSTQNASQKKGRILQCNYCELCVPNYFLIFIQKRPSSFSNYKMWVLN